MNRPKQNALFVCLVNNTLKIIPRERVNRYVLKYVKENVNEFVRYIKHIRKAFAPDNMQPVANTNIAVKVHNLKLNRDVYYLVNGEIPGLRSADGLIIYLPFEVECLIRSKRTPKEIDMINMIKEIFFEGPPIIVE
jgi:hypothetical protein